MTPNQEKYGTFVGVSHDEVGVSLVVYAAGAEHASRIILTLDDVRTLIVTLTKVLADRVLNSTRILTHTLVDPQQIGPSGAPVPPDLWPATHTHGPIRAEGKAPT